MDKRDSKGRFIKGSQINLGRSYAHTEEFKQARRDYRHTLEAKIKIGLAQKGRIGRKWTEEQRQTVSNLRKTRVGPLASNWKGGLPKCEECGKGLVNRVGRYCRQHIGKIYSGSKVHTWRGGVTPINAKIRHSIAYKQWRRDVFERDNYTCQACGVRGGELQADHIKPFAFHSDLRFDLNNGRTLCKPCHRKTPTYGYNSGRSLTLQAHG